MLNAIIGKIFKLQCLDKKTIWKYVVVIRKTESTIL